MKKTWTDDPITPESYPPQTNALIGNWFVAAPESWQTKLKMEWMGSGGAMNFTCLATISSSAGDVGMAAGIATDPETEYTVTFNTDNGNAGTLTARIIHYNNSSHTTYTLLREISVSRSSQNHISFTATGDSVWLWVGHKANGTNLAAGTNFKVTSGSMLRYTWSVAQSRIQSYLYNYGAYRFAYNGIERTDEKAGKGNYYTALHGEYDPRTTKRDNVDPKSVFGISPYAMFGDNPIRFTDVLLDSIGIQGFRQGKILKDLNRGLLVEKKKSPYSFNKSGRLVVDDDKYNALTDEQKEIASPVRELANADLDVQIVKGKWRDVIPNSEGQTLGNYGGAATVANRGSDGTSQDLTGRSGITILWTGKGESFSPERGKPIIYQTNATSIYHEIGHAFFRFLKLDPKQAGKTIDYENKVRKQSNEMLKEYQHRDYDKYHKDPNAL